MSSFANTEFNRYKESIYNSTIYDGCRRTYCLLCIPDLNSSPYTNSIDAVSKHCGECFKTRKDKAKVIKHYKAKQNIIVQLQKDRGYVEKKTLLVCL